MKAKNKPAEGVNSAEVLKKLLARIAKYRLLLVLSIILAAATVVLQLYVPILFGDAIDEIVAAHAVRFDAMWAYLRRILVFAAVSGVTGWVMSLINNRMTYRVVQDIRAQSIRHIQRLPLAYLDRHSSGDIVSRIIADADILSDGLLLGFTQLFSGVVTIAVTLVFMFSKNVWITLLVILLTPLSFVVAKFISTHSYSMFRRQSEARGRQTALIEEMIGSQKVVRAFGYEEKASARFAAVNEELKNYSQQAVFYSSLTNPATRFVNNVIYAGVALTGAFLIPGGALTVGGLSVLLSYANQYMKPFNDISSVVTEMQNALACAARLFALLEEGEETADASGTLETVEGRVDIDGVAFSYDKSRPLIESFDLRAAPGMRVAIVGPTGCGKTTFINLLMRFYDVDGGSISVDGREIRSLSRHALRSCFGMVLQDTWIKQGTVRENIAFGKPGATDEEIIAAAKTVRAHEFISEMPDGYYTQVNERGSRLSQGQKQLIAFARTLLSDPKILVLDEATSSIDAKTERLLQEGLQALLKGRTSFIIAHRLSTIKNCDRILYISNKGIAESGSHDELMEQKGHYYQLYTAQLEE